MPLKINKSKGRSFGMQSGSRSIFRIAREAFFKNLI